MIPAFKKAGAHFEQISSNGGISGAHTGRKYGFARTTTDSDILFNDKNTDAIIVTTRHNNHANFVIQALEAENMYL